jgi:hypothetical protein
MRSLGFIKPSDARRISYEEARRFELHEKSIAGEDSRSSPSSREAC